MIQKGLGIIMGKRTLALSVGLLSTLFFPWFSVNMIVTHLSFPGYKLGAVGVFIVILGVLGILASTLKHLRFRALVECILGLGYVLLVLIASSGFYSNISNSVDQFTGGSYITGSGVAQAIGSTGVGFYLAFILGMILLLFGARNVLMLNHERLFPERWSVDSLFKGELNQPQTSTTVTETSARVQHVATESVANLKRVLSTRRGKTLFQVFGIVALYLITLVLYNSSQTYSGTIQSLESAVANKDVTAVKDMLITNTPLSKGAYTGFVDYYAEHPNGLNSLLTSTANNGFASLFTNSVQVQPVRKVFFGGFRSYQIEMSSTQMQLSGPKNVSWSVAGNGVTMPVNVLPAQYTVTATVSSPFGPVSETKNEDATLGNVQDTFGFTNNMLTIQSADIAGNMLGNIAGKSIPINLQNNNSFSITMSAQIGPYPNLNGKIVQVVGKSTWGDFVESGTIQNGSCTVQAQGNDNPKLLDTLAQTINKSNIAWVTDEATGNWSNGKTRQYIVPNSPGYQFYTSQSGSGHVQYLRMVASPNLSITTVSNNAIGVNVLDSEYYYGNGSKSEANWVYSMQYNPSTKKWLIYNVQSGSHISSRTPGAVVIQH